MRVEAETLQFDGKLPLIAMPFVGWIPRVLKKTLSQQIFRRETHPSAAWRGRSKVICSNGSFSAHPESRRSDAGRVCLQPVPRGRGTRGGSDQGRSRLPDRRILQRGTGVPHHVSELLKRRTFAQSSATFNLDCTNISRGRPHTSRSCATRLTESYRSTTTQNFRIRRASKSSPPAPRSKKWITIRRVALPESTLRSVVVPVRCLTRLARTCVATSL